MEHPRISRDPEVMVGKPCVSGTRLTVEHILRHLSHGLTNEQMIEDYPRLTQEDVLAVIAYAADVVSHEAKIAA